MNPEYMATHSGRPFYPLNPECNEIWIPDIAHALSRSGRFNGHTRVFYSIAQHSVHVAELVEELGGTRDEQLAGLMHDAAEAYVGDVITQVKKLIPAFVALEDRHLKHILGICGLGGSLPEIVKQADEMMLVAEAQDLFSVEAFSKLFAPILPVRDHRCPGVVPWASSTAEVRWLQKFGELHGRN